MEGQGPLCSSLDPWLYPVRSPGLATGEPPQPRSNNRTSTDQVFIGCASPNLAGPIVDQPRQWKKSHWALTEADPRLPPAGHMRLCRPGQSLAAWQRLNPRKCPSKARSQKKKKSPEPTSHVYLAPPQPLHPGMPAAATTWEMPGCCHGCCCHWQHWHWHCWCWREQGGGCSDVEGSPPGRRAIPSPPSQFQ